MKRFTEYLNEDFDPAVFNADGGISINDPTVVDAINSNLEVATSCSYRTPYNGLEEVAKTLAYYKIFLPKGVFLDQNHGNDVFEVSQFGEKMGMNNQGEVVTASDSPLFVYFEWSLNEKGMYDTFACLCDQEELDEILADFDSEVETDEDLQEQHSMGKVSKMLYKIVNQQMADKNCDDVNSYIEHEKQGKTFTQVNEEVMPNPKKKMGAKKVTLSNMMRKEETINEALPVSYFARPLPKDPAPGKFDDIVKRAVKSAKNKQKPVKEETDKQTMIRYGMGPSKKKNDVPFDMPTEKPSTPYKNKAAKAKQLARAAMKKAKTEKK